MIVNLNTSLVEHELAYIISDADIKYICHVCHDRFEQTVSGAALRATGLENAIPIMVVPESTTAEDAGNLRYELKHPPADQPVSGLSAWHSPEYGDISDDSVSSPVVRSLPYQMYFTSGTTGRPTLTLIGCVLFASYGMTEFCGKISMSIIPHTVAQMR